MTDLDFETDALCLTALRASIKALEAEVANITARYADVDDDKYVAGDFILVVSHQDRFDPATAQRSLTKAQFASILKPKPDAALAKAILTPAQYAKTTKPTAKSVTVKPITDIA